MAQTYISTNIATGLPGDAERSDISFPLAPMDPAFALYPVVESTVGAGLPMGPVITMNLVATPITINGVVFAKQWQRVKTFRAQTAGEISADKDLAANNVGDGPLGQLLVVLINALLKVINEQRLAHAGAAVSAGQLDNYASAPLQANQAIDLPALKAYVRTKQ